ncbi:16193_t:CDS:1 [Acaulospora morrowiae]|uniref:16193_t:CDS:1 n=1 Tax=Acaulospora morrowiae TaxID=94023 RepID=A0A9N9I7H6_9GLOM|nr:16193_t:CDS:1 [Acaulospora morrowiae]
MLLVFIIVYVVMTIILIVNQVQSKEAAITRCNNLNSTASCQDVETWKIIRNAVLAGILIVFEVRYSKRNGNLVGGCSLSIGLKKKNQNQKRYLQVFFAGIASRYATDLENTFRLKRRRVAPTSSLSVAGLTSKEYYDPHAHHRPA